MARQCTICSHPQKKEIEIALHSGQSLRDVAGQYHLAKSALARHKDGHSTRQLKTGQTQPSPVTRAPIKRPQGQNIPDDLRDEVQQHFLDAFVLHGVVTRACQEIGIHRSILRQWVEHDEKFAMAYELAKEKVNDLYRDEARRRAVEGVETYVVSQGKVVFVEVDDEKGDKKAVPLTERKYSDTMLQFMMKARMPEYREKQQVDITSNGATVGQSVSLTDLAVLQEQVAARLYVWRQGHVTHDDLSST